MAENQAMKQMKQLIAFNKYYRQIFWSERKIIEDLLFRENHTYVGTVSEYSRELEMGKDPSNTRKAISSLNEKNVINVKFVQKTSKKGRKMKVKTMTCCTLNENWISVIVDMFLNQEQKEIV